LTELSVCVVFAVALVVKAEQGHCQLGVRNASGMLRLWIPGVVAAAPHKLGPTRGSAGR
jgi:hypothetical protein